MPNQIFKDIHIHISVNISKKNINRYKHVMQLMRDVSSCLLLLISKPLCRSRATGAWCCMPFWSHKLFPKINGNALVAQNSLDSQ